ncbi:unnamed protein product [Durusdinium trenchii]|uniref:Uncharacterized protein n=1 Tax=Durusdinium trenchii TaxID=1381693 RepID=A0ABP0T0V5_9DINO
MSKHRPDVPCLLGAWRRPPNDLQEQVVGGGHKAIHDDATAAQAFGPAWFETGSISVHFVNMVGHLQPVRCFLERSDASQRKVWMEHLDGRLVFDGTASVGTRNASSPKTMAQTKIANVKPVKGRLLFTRHEMGTESLELEPARIDFDQVVGPLFPFTHRRKLELITEFHPWFSEEAGSSSPWGRPILPPESFNQIMLGMVGGALGPRFPSLPGDAWLEEALKGRTPVGLFGGCEVILHAGPVFVGEDYQCRRQLVACGETPKAEFRWTRTFLYEKKSGKLVAEMTLQDMQLKNSLEGYAELRARSDATQAKL